MPRLPSYGRRNPKSRIRRRPSKYSKSRTTFLSRRRAALLRRRPSVPRPVWTKRSTVVKLTYCDRITLNPTSAAMEGYIFRANSCHDPDYSLGGHQPRYWDLMTPGWKTYTVLGSRMIAKFMPTTTSTAVVPGAFFAYTDGVTAIPYSDIADAREDRQRIVAAGPVDGPARNAVTTFSLSKTLGTKKIGFSPEWSALISSDPTSQRYHHIVAGSSSGDPVAMTFLITIDYIVRLSNGNVDVGDS